VLKLPLIAALCALALVVATAFAGASGEPIKRDGSVGNSCERNSGLAADSALAGGSGWTFEGGVAVIDGDIPPCSRVSVRRSR
jgi:hypothetical protein